MRFRTGHLMIVVASEAVLFRAALALAVHRDLPIVFGKVAGLWMILHLMTVVPGVVLILRMRTRRPAGSA